VCKDRPTGISTMRRCRRAGGRFEGPYGKGKEHGEGLKKGRDNMSLTEAGDQVMEVPVIHLLRAEKLTDKRGREKPQHFLKCAS